MMLAKDVYQAPSAQLSECPPTTLLAEHAVAPFLGVGDVAVLGSDVEISA
jgi:hypothetical protein